MLVTQRVQHNIQQNSILEEVKKWSLNGYEVFSAILNKLCNLAVISEGMMFYRYFYIIYFTMSVWKVSSHLVLTNTHCD